jgi:PAS domain S-box-containing protein
MVQIARKPSSAIATLVAFAVVAFWITLRVLLFRDIVLPLTYVLPLMVCIWTRRFWHLWTMAVLFALAASVKQFVILPSEALPEWVDWVTLSITLINIGFGTLVIAAIMRMRSRLEAQAQHLSDRNAEISAQAWELSQQNQEIARQNEEMQSQAAELERQNEKLHQINDTLGRREDLLQVLLDLARKPATGDRSLHEMCRQMISVIGAPAISIALLERQGDELVVSACAGPEGASELQSVWSYAGSVAELVIRERCAACIDDLAARPGITVPCHRGTTVRSALAAPLLSGNASTGAVVICGSEVHHWTDEQFHLSQWIASQYSLILEARLWQDELREVALLPEQNPDAVIRVLTGGTVIYANPAGIHMLRERGSGLDHGAPDELWMPAQEVFNSGRITDREVQVGDRTYAVRYVPVVDREYVNIYAHDITRRRKAEERLRSVLDQSVDLIYRRDLRIDQYDYISPSCTQVFGIPPSEMVHMGTDELLCRMHPEDLPAVRKGIAAAEQDGSASVQYRLRLPDGQWHWMADHVRIIRDDEGRAIYRSGSVRDITEQVESREQLRRHAEELQKLMDVAPVTTTPEYPVPAIVPATPQA